ncbi:uncharacterized protein LOC129574485 [Sitodiplosis mosellana]|uniref:uncharacterized protein LOC129574485 n=1 Tax=Sitodiplosis mosellana TaxID=263140 RepID=UPI002443DC7D|nr:uncharacterized protein LOC129574485 [Sitodiplosis mosellana]
MSKGQDKEVDWQQVKQDLVVQREEKWDKFFDKYKGMDKVIEDEALSEYSESELTSGESNSGDEVEVNDFEDDDRLSESNNVPDEGNVSDANSCIEVSDDDDAISTFVKTYKELAQNKIKIMEKTYEEHTRNDIKTKGRIESHRHSKYTTEKTAEATTGNMVTMAIDSPMALSNAIKSMNNSTNSSMNTNANSMELVKPTMSRVGGDEPSSNAVSAVDEATACEVFKKGNVQFLRKTTILTTTTITTTKEEITTIVQQNAGEQGDIGTPKKANLAKQPKSTKKKRTSDEPMPDYDENDYDGFNTPGRRKTRAPNTPSTSSSFTAQGSCIEVILTPSGSKNIVTRKEIQYKLNETMPNSAEKCPSVVRNVRADKGKRLSLMMTPQPKAIMPPEIQSDNLFQMGIVQRPLIARTTDDKGFGEIL